MTDLATWLSRIEGMHPSEIELGLARIQTVFDRLELPEITCPIITLTGTNGKGSTQALLKSIYQQAGYRVGVYSSPHLVTFNERIQINEHCISDQDLVAAFEKIEAQRGDVALTFFEFTTLAAFCYFAEQNCDVLLLEVGLGGRLDAVNLLDPTLSIVTNIGLDHTNYLGPTRDSIAREKAGIFRSKQPVVCGDPQPPAALSDIAEQLACPFYAIGRDFYLQSDGDLCAFVTGDRRLEHLPLSAFHPNNLAVALMAVHCLQQILPVQQAEIAQGIAQAKLAGRLQRVPGEVEWVLDVAHNVDSAKVLSDWLRANPCQGKTWALFSMLADKDITGTVNTVAESISHWSAGALDVPRAASKAQLVSALVAERADCYDEFQQAYEQVVQTAQKGDRVVVFGSFYTVAKALEMGV